MNNDRRKQIRRAIASLEALTASLEEAKTLVEEIKSEEEDYRDNMPENLQGSDRYEAADSAVSYLEEAYSSLDEISLEDVISQLEEAAA